MKPIVIDLWGSMACFTPPYAKVERYSYAVPTPSALRGILASIYEKPSEFYWKIKRIEVMRPIRYFSCKRNEVKVRITGLKPISVDDVHTPRTTMFLKDVRYRVTAEIVPFQKGTDVENSLYHQAVRRIKKGQCFRQPYLGIRECICYFALSDGTETPIDESMNLNLMPFDTHVPYDNNRGGSDINMSLYQCVMNHGVIEVPEYDSPEVLKMGVVGHA